MEEDDKQGIFRAICRNGGIMPYKDLVDVGLIPQRCIDEILKNCPDIFSATRVNGVEVVSVRSDIRLCKIRDCNGCQDLHMCRQYILGECANDWCPFSHSWNSSANNAVLKRYGLQGLGIPEIKALLCQSDEICCFHLIGRCNAVGCDKVHSSKPYKWQIWTNYQWRDLPNNQEIERDYCNPAKTQHAGDPAVDFSRMSCASDAVRRLSISSASPVHTVSSLSKWIWYWEEAEGAWEEFQLPDGDNRSLKDELERLYLNGETAAEFCIRNQKYELSFSGMIQTNCSTRTQRLVRRRPKFNSDAEGCKAFGTYCSKDSQILPASLPDNWDLGLIPTTGFERIKLDTSSCEYSEIFSLFSQTMPGYNVNIEKIQNLTLWKFFDLQRNDMKTKAGKDVDERLLFLGTETQHVDAICHENIDWRMCGKNGTVFGEGSYFAQDAKYSNDYANNLGTKSMFVCRVLVGDFTSGRRHYKKPPQKGRSKKMAFDSCVNDIDQPSIFVIFEKNQIYPEYLIQYEDPREEKVARPLQTTQAPSPVVSTNRSPDTALVVQAPPLPTPFYGSPSGSSHFNPSNTTNALNHTGNVGVWPPSSNCNCDSWDGDGCCAYAPCCDSDCSDCCDCDCDCCTCECCDGDCCGCRCDDCKCDCHFSLFDLLECCTCCFCCCD